MTEAIKTIQFNTGRKYTAEGQIITATLYTDGIVTFYDSSRMIDGGYATNTTALAEKSDDTIAAQVLRAYDTGTYERSKRSFHDGLFTFSRNTRDGFDALTKLEALPKPDAVEASGGLIALDNLLADFCGSLGFARASADEVLAFVSGNRVGDVNRMICEWLMDFIMAYEGGDEPDPEPETFRVMGEGSVELATFPTETEARAFVDGYTRLGDWGGYTFIHIENPVTGEAWTFSAPQPEAEPEVEAEYPDHLDAGEREIIDTIIDAALAEGFEIKVRDEEEIAQDYTTDKALIAPHIGATDVTNLFMRKVGKKRIGFIQFIHGNMPYEVVADSTDSPEIAALIDAAQPIIDRLEAETVGA